LQCQGNIGGDTEQGSNLHSPHDSGSHDSIKSARQVGHQYGCSCRQKDDHQGCLTIACCSLTARRINVRGLCGLRSEWVDLVLLPR
jgi:hypothetical protein